MKHALIEENDCEMEWKLRLEAENEKGLTVKFDAPIPHGGEETALSPMENVLASLAACSSFHVLTILKKKRLNVTGYTVEATAERREDEPPRVFTKIHLRYVIRGSKLTSKAVEETIRLAEDKYCSVGGMLRNSVPITSSFEIQKEE